ncbi:PhzF family phenazine biosynthesis protein [Microbacterium sp. ZW T5_56]|uniref:PhzF family phenazine biosynthesis protein n=1 Tax=Microbacterium sp. ZW T5_56 TaxID=3378081 RepID=UPI0038520775
MTLRRYTEVDVFSPTVYQGNPVAVVHDAEGLTTQQMQRFAKWTNLAETTFLLPPTSEEADYRLRIFSATQEFPFAGHPTLGSALAWLHAGGVPRRSGEVVQECGAGLVPVRIEDAMLAFAAPPLTRFSPVDEAELMEVAEILGIDRIDIRDASWLVNGPEWMGVRLASAAEVLALRPDPAALGARCIGVIGEHPSESDIRYEVRAFVGNDPVWEDPITGSLNAGLALWLRETGVTTDGYVAAQGTVIDHEGRVHVSYDDGQIWVGGNAFVCVNGHVEL